MPRSISTRYLFPLTRLKARAASSSPPLKVRIVLPSSSLQMTFCALKFVGTGSSSWLSASIKWKFLRTASNNSSPSISCKDFRFPSSLTSTRISSLNTMLISDSTNGCPLTSGSNFSSAVGGMTSSVLICSVLTSSIKLPARS